jgi:hypothetical protein
MYAYVIAAKGIRDYGVRLIEAEARLPQLASAIFH